MTTRYHTPNLARPQNTRTQRFATVHSNSYPPLADSHAYQSWRPIPWINLRGHWLHHAGFSIGMPYRITVDEGLLILQIVRAGEEVIDWPPTSLATQLANT